MGKWGSGGVREWEWSTGYDEVYMYVVKQLNSTQLNSTQLNSPALTHSLTHSLTRQAECCSVAFCRAGTTEQVSCPAALLLYAA